MLESASHVLTKSLQMLQRDWRLNGGLSVEQSVRAADNMTRLIAALRRQAWLVVALCLAGLGIGALYIATATPLYTASANILIDNREVRAVHDISTLSDPTRLDDVSEVVQSQVEVLRSEKVGMAVVKKLNLSEDPAFVDPRESLIGKIWTSFIGQLGAITAPFIGTLGTITAPSQPSDDANSGFKRQQMALKTLNENVRIIHVAHTSVVQVNFTSPSPVRAAEIANAYTDAYLAEQLSSRVEATHSARRWLQQRSEELRQLSIDADLAAQKFKADNNLLATKGTLISEQQLNEMTTELVNARTATAQAQARYLRIKNIIDTRQTEAAVSESLDNAVISGLRTKYLDATSRLSGLKRDHSLRPDHIAVINLKNTVEELSTLLFQELGRVAESYRSNYEVAAAQEQALANHLTQQQSDAVRANNAQVQLRQLEQKAEAYKTLQQTFLTRFQESAQQETFPMTDAHVFSEATPPLAPSHPRRSLVLTIALALGTLAGVGIAMLRESRDVVFRTTEQVRDELSVDALGMLPIISHASFAQKRAPNTTAPILRYAIDDPFSAFAETLRSAKVAADLRLHGRSPKIIGLVSLLPGEGKSTVAKNFASLLALQRAKTLLIDADTRNPALTRAMGCEGRRRKSSAISPLAELVRCESETGLQILPCIYAKDDLRVAEGLSSENLHALLRSSDQSFECVVIVLPPIGPVVSARGMASSIDAFIFVVEWGMTSRGAVRAALAKECLISEKLLGVILNKVNMKKLKSYEHFGSDGYYLKHYENYYNHIAS
jgi:succinoglycan biosynthesis transport protein ExoP